MGEYTKGRGAQYNPHNKFFQQTCGIVHEEGIDEWEQEKAKTIFTTVHPKTLVNKVKSPDVGMMYSANPYQGCEHGCIYCYARNSHQYWGLSSGLDFESKILVKQNAPQLFEEFLKRPKWDASTISLSGNTDCYQPIERKFQLTRQILKIALQYGQPIGIITKNGLVQRDMDILKEMAYKNLCAVYISINSLTEETRSKLEPRTATAKQRLRTIEMLAQNDIPTGIMCAPIIPGLTDHEVPQVLKAAKDHGASWAGYTIVRLNGQLSELFEDWLRHTYPLRADKIWHQIQGCHGGKVNNSEYGHRMRGSGNFAEIIRDNFRLHCLKNGLNKHKLVFSTAHFHPNHNGQLRLF